MPYINIRLGKSISNEEQQQLFTQTTFLMNRIMGKRKEVTVVHINTGEADGWSTNGVALCPDDPVAAYVDIKVTEGTNSDAEKAAMLSETIAMLQDVIGTVQEACYVVIDEIPATSWGYNGQSQAARAAANLSL